MNAIIREYNFENDPPKIVNHLFTKFQGDEGIAKIREGDTFFQEKPDIRKRFVAEVDNELHSTCVLVKEEMGGDKGSQQKLCFCISSLGWNKHVE